MTTKPEYHPDTCWTAKQLRDLGFKIPDEIPDNAWVSKKSCQMDSSIGQTQPPGGHSFSLSTQLTFTEPFRWIEVKAIVQKKD